MSDNHEDIPSDNESDNNSIYNEENDDDDYDNEDDNVKIQPINKILKTTKTNNLIDDEASDLDELDENDALDIEDLDADADADDGHVGGAGDDDDADDDASDAATTDTDADATDDDEEEGGNKKVTNKKQPQKPKIGLQPGIKQHDPLSLSDDEDEENDDELYLQKFNAEVNKNYIVDFHPECMIHNYNEIALMSKVIRDDDNNIIDDLHRSIPFLTKYEKSRVLGQRAKQINTGAKAFVKIPEKIIDGYLVAELELMQKRIPFIIRRPIAGGGCEYWNLKDLENIGF